MSEKAVITCALNGVLTDPKQHHVPVTPEEMAREAKAAFNANAAGKKLGDVFAAALAVAEPKAVLAAKSAAALVAPKPVTAPRRPWRLARSVLSTHKTVCPRQAELS